MIESAPIDTLTNLANRMRLKTIEMAYKAGANGAHLGPALSCTEILACLYGAFMNANGRSQPDGWKDVFIPSKAHCVLSFYTALAFTGRFPEQDLDTFEVDGSDLPGHPVMNADRGIDFSGGSLGMGPAQGIGMALAYRRKGCDGNIFVLLGDGECDEGSIWEAAMSAAHFKLDNLILIIDNNKLQYDGGTEQIMALRSLADKFSSFGFEVFAVNGHHMGDLHAVFTEATGHRDGRPKVIVADTVKGKGVSFMENKKEWHHSRLSKELYEQAVAELSPTRQS
jgi:transketolase